MPLSGLGPSVIGVMVTESVLTFIFVSFRITARIKLLGGLRSDDYLVGMALLTMFIISALNIVAAFNGMGQHNTRLTPKENIRATQLIIIAQSCNCSAIAASKSAVVIFSSKSLSTNGAPLLTSA
ncbi:hypothetical protein K432DRAFT_178896 [Lepidopterella palustris CBS 459.81]|uniref:Rhodopsin domain-containing protein n=1 Tax=Lepidopterella palustris CBS 459.81 TaxID=1314670 RepID=A0A8E2E0M2_9PEZI|nr:hypothetical protein K432DRAFT_178896 [Lepidopterella palustris CBS 459.81]